MQRIIVSYAVWKQIADANPTWARYHSARGDSWHIAVGHRDVQFLSDAMAGTDKADFDATYTDSTLVSSREDAVALLIGLNIKPVPRSSRGAPLTQNDVREGSKIQIMSQNFCDKRTWYSTSVRRTAQTMTDTGDGLVWALAADKYGVDVMHGRIAHERRIRTQYKPVVKVDGVTKVEKDPHTDVGDYVIDYKTMRVTFTSTQAGATVTLDFSEVVNSKWYLRPTAGKRLRLISAELQFSVDARMDDTFIFQPRGDVAKHAALTTYWDGNDPAGPYPAGTMLPLGDPTCYQTIFDLICEANLSYPVIPAFKHDTPTWRDTAVDVRIFSWDYGQQAVVNVSDGAGWDPNDIEISLEHDLEMEGTQAVVTFYALSEDIE